GLGGTGRGPGEGAPGQLDPGQGAEQRAGPQGVAHELAQAPAQDGGGQVEVPPAQVDPGQRPAGRDPVLERGQHVGGLLDPALVEPQVGQVGDGGGPGGDGGGLGG